MPLSHHIGPEAEYLAALREGRLIYQRGPGGQAVFPPRLALPGDGAALEWAVSAGLGYVHAITEQPRKPPEPSTFIAIVQLDEGFRMLSRIDCTAPISIGHRLRAVIAATADPPHVHFVPEAPHVA